MPQFCHVHADYFFFYILVRRLGVEELVRIGVKELVRIGNQELVRIGVEELVRIGG